MGQHGPEKAHLFSHLYQYRGEIFHIIVIGYIGKVLDIHPDEDMIRHAFCQRVECGPVFAASSTPFSTKASDEGNVRLGENAR